MSALNNEQYRALSVFYGRAVNPDSVLPASTAHTLKLGAVHEDLTAMRGGARGCHRNLQHVQ